MSVSIEIVPLQKSLHMFGEPDPWSAYSLSGHVQITLSPSFLSRRTSKVLLQSLELTFEGQSEVAAPAVGYSALRLCSTTTQLVPQDPVLLSGEGDESSGEHCRWNAIFNINIPGWLPESCSFGSDNLGVSYRLFATAKYVDVASHKRDNSSSWSFSSLYSAFDSGARTAVASKGIRVKRFIGLPEDEPSPVSTTTFFLSHPKADTPENGEPCIPPEVLSKIRVLASVPEYLNVEESSVQLTMRLRTKSLSAEECKRLQLLGFTVDVIQKDKCRARPSREFRTRYPLPAERDQPPHVPLRWSNTSVLSYAVGYPGNGNPDASYSRSFSLLPPAEDGKYTLQHENYIFANDADPNDKPTWYTLQTNIPIMKTALPDLDHEWAGTPVLRASTAGPLMTVRHEISITLPLSYDIPGSSQKAKQNLVFAIPIRFASPAPVMNRQKLSPSSHPSPSACITSTPSSTRSETPDHCVELDRGIIPSKSSSHTPILPPYSQFYYSNGDRKLVPTPPPPYALRDDDCDSTDSSADSTDEEDERSLPTTPVFVPAVPLFSEKVRLEL